jgi:hypothetical protein
MAISSTLAALAILGGMAACSEAGTHSAGEPSAGASDIPGVAPPDGGEFEPGTYRHTIEASCEPGEISFCPTNAVPPPPLTVEVTVPAGWTPLESGSSVIARDTEALTEAPDGAALVLGWTSWLVGLNTDPCLSQAHETPDLIPGLSAADFVEAVQAQEALDVTEPVGATIGGRPARFFTLHAPADLSGCDNWRPWDPGFFAQGPNNIWDVWVVDVDGTRVLIVTEYFPGTPQEAVAQLGEMVESLSFGA